MSVSLFQIMFIVLFGIFCDYDTEWYDPDWTRQLSLGNDTLTNEIEHKIKHADEHLTRSYACKFIINLEETLINGTLKICLHHFLSHFSK